MKGIVRGRTALITISAYPKVHAMSPGGAGPVKGKAGVL